MFCYQHMECVCFAEAIGSIRSKKLVKDEFAVRIGMM